MIASMWSGGKDSCLALYKTLKSGLIVKKLVSMLRDNRNAHGYGREVLEKQADCLGIDIVFGDMEKYEESLKEIVEEFGIESIVYGDIYLSEHRYWIEEVCRRLKVDPIFPLWGRDTEEVAKEFISEGFEAYIVAVKKVYYKILCRKYNLDLLREIKEMGIDPCGENGEFHTVVSYGPIFKKRLNFRFEKILEYGDSYIVKLEV
ncbi:MAG: diphthine--ammonia ligase [Archaeoglobaceae archaeon]|nr:diphthine--ammonia ligase [Archaeoglobaceae archaeon]MCX8151722.1 diphthine--ammonia ligase [Archaeoglobaceae archaeon]MDW8013851.1 diphthine--ammonia ligase [Archaeoglobaceae archaeon]